jgi:hypothetical protein
VVAVFATHSKIPLIEILAGIILNSVVGYLIQELEQVLPMLIVAASTIVYIVLNYLHLVFAALCVGIRLLWWQMKILHQSMNS